MSKLINIPETILGGETGNKETLQFSNPAIEKYLPTFGNLRHKSIPFKVPLRSHLKGLTLSVSRATKKKYFVLRYWFQSKYRPYTLGTYGPGFGVKEVRSWVPGNRTPLWELENSFLWIEKKLKL